MPLHPQAQAIADFYAAVRTTPFAELPPAEARAVYNAGQIPSDEAVHEIRSWDDLRGRIEPGDRRCYGFFHPALVDDPLIFVEVALTRGTPAAIAPILPIATPDVFRGGASPSQIGPRDADVTMETIFLEEPPCDMNDPFDAFSWSTPCSPWH